MSTPATLPPRLAELAEEFEDISPNERLQLLLELSGELPDVPPHVARESMQRVPECQSPLSLSGRKLIVSPSGSGPLRGRSG